MATRTNFGQMLAELTETFGEKAMRRTKKYSATCKLNKRRGTQVMELIGLPYRMEYEFSPAHIECIESYGELTTDWAGDITYRLTPFNLMEHCQMQMVGNRYVRYLNQN